jgi:MoaA/NifB/PqqE/SkfB family radical SAM enzyme
MIDKADLLKSKHFCIQPFIHSCIWTDSRVIPCCINQHYVLGNTKTTPLSEIYSNNNKKLVNLRKEMIQGTELPASCRRCSIMEKNYADNSYRHYSNKHYGNKIFDIEINEDGTVEKNKVFTWDVRFSNLCNLRCRTCDSTNSSKIAEEEYRYKNKETIVLKEAFDDSNEFFDFFLANINNIQDIYFCGGEPLLLEDHYKILDLLIEHKKFNVRIRYSTNCTKLGFKDKNVVDDYWTKFKYINLGLSLDAGWEQLHYIRGGAEWDTVVYNLKYIVEKCPHIFVQFSPTVSLLNAFHLHQLHKFLVEEKILKISDTYFNILTYPVFYSITAFPENLKNEFKLYWENYKQDMQNMGCNDYLVSELDKVIKYMYTDDHSNTIPEFKKETDLKDSLRKEDFLLLFPELKQLII